MFDANIYLFLHDCMHCAADWIIASMSGGVPNQVADEYSELNNQMIVS